MTASRPTNNGSRTRPSKQAKGRPPLAVPLPDELDLSQLLAVLGAIRKGDFTVRMPADRRHRRQDRRHAQRHRRAQRRHRPRARAGQQGGRQGGPIGQRAPLRAPRARGRVSIDSVNTLIGDLVQPTSEVARVIGAVAKGDLSQTMALEIDGRPLEGEFLRIGKTVNTMVDQLGSFASEVTRVAREVGTEGKLGGQAEVEGRGRHLEGPHRQRQLDGRQPDRPGAQHRRGDDRGRQRRPVQEDHRRRARARSWS